MLKDWAKVPKHRLSRMLLNQISWTLSSPGCVCTAFSSSCVLSEAPVNSSDQQQLKLVSLSRWHPDDVHICTPMKEETATSWFSHVIIIRLVRTHMNDCFTGNKLWWNSSNIFLVRHTCLCLSSLWKHVPPEAQVGSLTSLIMTHTEHMFHTGGIQERTNAEGDPARGVPVQQWS